MNNESKQIKEYLNSKKQIEDISEALEDLNRKIEEIIKPLEDELQNQKNQLRNLSQEINVYVKIGDLAQEISALTTTPENELTTELNYMRSTFAVFPKNHLLNIYENNPVVLMLKIYNGSTNLYVNTSLTLNLTDKTSDGQTLIDNSTVSTVDGLNLMILKVNEEHIPDVMFKVNFKELNKKDDLKNKAILECLKHQKYMTEDEVTNLKPKKESKSKQKTLTRITL